MLMGAGAPATGAADTASVPPVSAINVAARAHRARKRVVTSYHPLHGQATSADDAAGHYALSGMGCTTRGASYPALAGGPRAGRCLICSLVIAVFLAGG